ncbi:MAG TPA: hypothetical protein VFI06_15490 [Chitinophagaceae bacterium]|nr:hypothetical protein [Chitinophagaceae bacterium]
MKILLVVCVFSLTQFNLFGQDKDTIPNSLDVFRTFYSHYSTDSLGYSRVFLEKKPRGWFILTKKVTDNKVVDDKRLLYYDFLTRQFLPLDLPRANKEVIDATDYIDPFDLEYFNLYPYYGYNGWYKDVIAKLEAQKIYADQDLYLLARAYSAFATSLLSNQFGYGVPEECFNPPLKPNSLTVSQANQYQAICKKASDLFAQLKKQNPMFNTIVGNISIKYANEIVTPFHCLMAYAPEYAKNIKLPDKLYPDSIIQQARDWMNNCPEGSIFLSFGDNDFYPLLYLQQHDGFRKDIYVVSYNLLGMDRYIYAYSRPLFKAKGVAFAADTAIYSNERNYYVYLDDSDHVFGMNQLLNSMRTRIDKEVPNLAGNTVAITLKTDGTFRTNTNFKIDGSYIGMNQWILLDIIDHLNGRPLVLPNQFYDQLKNLNNYLNWNGKVFRYENY